MHASGQSPAYTPSTISVLYSYSFSFSRSLSLPRSRSFFSHTAAVQSYKIFGKAVEAYTEIKNEFENENIPPDHHQTLHLYLIRLHYSQFSYSTIAIMS